MANAPQARGFNGISMCKEGRVETHAFGASFQLKRSCPLCHESSGGLFPQLDVYH